MSSDRLRRLAGAVALAAGIAGAAAQTPGEPLPIAVTCPAGANGDFVLVTQDPSGVRLRETLTLAGGAVVALESALARRGSDRFDVQSRYDLQQETVANAPALGTAVRLGPVEKMELAAIRGKLDDARRAACLGGAAEQAAYRKSLADNRQKLGLK